MHNAPTHNKEDALIHTKTKQTQLQAPKTKKNKIKGEDSLDHCHGLPWRRIWHMICRLFIYVDDAL